MICDNNKSRLLVQIFSYNSRDRDWLKLFGIEFNPCYILFVIWLKLEYFLAFYLLAWFKNNTKALGWFTDSAFCFYCFGLPELMGQITFCFVIAEKINSRSVNFLKQIPLGLSNSFGEPNCPNVYSWHILDIQNVLIVLLWLGNH